ncbi:MAG: hypothetical protein JEZ12_12690 [Desulfobacterium sp.]|nr:hypothetical protein [Desulfobacterium sp.]
MAKPTIQKSYLALFICTFLIGFVLLSSSVFGGEPAIIDHTCVDITRIPESAIEQAKSTLHIAYGHTSHGSQVTSGMSGLVEFANNGGLGLALPHDIFKWYRGGTGGALDLHDYAMDRDAGYYPTWVNNTVDYLGPPDPGTGRGTTQGDVNVVIWSWCGQVSGRTEQEMAETYLTPMSRLETDYPGITFVYMTGHLDGTGANGNLNLRNEQIRDYCKNNGKVLYDFADIESYGPTGQTNYMLLNGDDDCSYDLNGTGDKNWATDWQQSHGEGVDWYDCYSAHSKPLNANLKAYAAWWLWAKIAGWNPDDASGDTASDPAVPGDDASDPSDPGPDASQDTSSDPSGTGDDSSDNPSSGGSGGGCFVRNLK